MSVVDVSFAIIALNVRGLPVSAKTKRPPCLPSDGASTTSGSSGSGCGSWYSATSAARRRHPAEADGSHQDDDEEQPARCRQRARHFT